MGKSHPHIDALREITARLPNFNPFFYNSSQEMELVCAYGKATSIGIYKDRHISIAKTTFFENTLLVSHTHSQKEMVSVLEGELEVHVLEDKGESVFFIRQYDSLEILPDTEHYCCNKEKVTIMVQTMPYSPQFPKPK